MYEQWKPTRKKQRRGQLLPFGVSLCLFALVFVAQGVLPQRLPPVRDITLSFLGGDTDVQTAFTQLGTALSQESLQLQDVGTFCLQVFGVLSPQEDMAEDAVMVFQPSYLPTTPSLWWEEPYQVVIAQQIPEPEPMAIGTILASYEGDYLETATSLTTYDYVYLGDFPSVNPVTSVVTSPFGVRVSPITGVLALHRGVDLRGTVGTPIVAWAEGTVIAVGETDEVGRYLRLDHGNEIHSFYAHCDQILVEEGQRVALGQDIALLGETGQVTGPHLHFEIRWGEVYLNPLHYIQQVD